MIRFLYHLSLTIMLLSLAALIVPMIETLHTWLMIATAVGLIGTIAFRMALDSKSLDHEN